MIVFLVLALLIASVPVAAADGAERAAGRVEEAPGIHPLVGQPAPGWDDLGWVKGGPLDGDSLRGRVVLVRWWTGPGCPYCRASAPSLQEWHERYRERGLTVVGMYHHKGPGKPTAEGVAELADRLGFTFPIAIDHGWRNLERWWPGEEKRVFTSVSFLVSRDGIVRYVHRGGAYNRSDSAEIEARIMKLLSAP